MWSLCVAVAMMQVDDPFHGAQWLSAWYDKKPIEKAKWIWVQKPGAPLPTTKGASAGVVTFRKEWDLPEHFFLSRISFAADNSCRVSINGHQYWQTQSHSSLTTANVDGILVPGKNVIEITATNDAATTDIVNPAGLIFAAETRIGNTYKTLVSDATWASADGTVRELGDFGTSPWNLRPPENVCPVFRRDVVLPVDARKATAKVIGLGHFDLYVNGKRQGDTFANQPWSQYDKTIYWQEFDLTQSLKKGRNAIGVALGNGFWKVNQPPQGRYTKGDAMPDFSIGLPQLLRVAIELELQDGSKQWIVTDEDWQWIDGPYQMSHIFAGEDFENQNWNPNWSDASWPMHGKPPLIVRPPSAKLLKTDFPLLKAAQSWKPKEIKNPKPGVWSYIFPQNASAFLRYKVKGPKGAKIKFRPSEVVSRDGEVQQLNLWGGDASCTYTLRGWPVAEEHEWRFWYHGFQFVEVTGAVPAGQPNPDNLPVLESLEMVHVRADNPQIGSFQSSSELYNRTHNLIDWAMRSNMSYVMTDCPHREKLGWQEQVQLLFTSFAYRYDSQAWFHKIERDILDAQLPDGRFLNVAPNFLVLPNDNPFMFTVEWGASGVLMPWQAYEWYGDKTFLTESYESMKRFVDWIDVNALDGLAPGGLGDWYDYGHGNPPGASRYTPTNLSSTAVWAMCVQAVSVAADALGKQEESAKYRTLHSKIRDSFLAKFYDPVKKTFQNSGSCQAANAMALCANLVPVEDREAVLNNIVAELEKREYQQTAGDIGHLYLIRALAQEGRSDVLHKIYSRTGLGSYGGILAKGLTTMPESWDATTVGSNSLNHCMLGHVMEWFYGWVLGIRQRPGSIGWKKVLIAPEPGSLTSAKGETKTPLGKVSVDWKKTGHDFSMTVEVPKGATATVALPIKTRILNVDGKPVPAKQGVFGRASVEVGPGKHVVRFDA